MNRITPAYAGKRWLSIWRQCYREDHPRLCGEKRRFPSLGLPVVGSPPPMRGKAKTGDCDRIEGRITPAYAGKSFSSFVVYIITQDHPRLCGEKGSPSLYSRSSSGSPPPMRGKAAFFNATRVS